MSFVQFPNQAYFIQPTVSGEATQLGTITVSENIELSSIVLNCQKVGIHSNETLRLELHNQQYPDTPIFVSDEYTYDDFGMGSTHWAGIISFDFPRVSLSSNLTYWVKIRVTNYTYTDDVRYIAFSFDWPEAINTPAVASFPAAAMGVYGYKA